jgi:flagellar basal-body rod protein FlgC
MDFDHVFSTFRISSSALAAERLRMNVIAHNLANANATRTPEGGPFRRHEVVFRTVLDRETRGGGEAHGEELAGVAVERIARSNAPFRVEYRPGHPDADPATGLLQLPNVDPVTEMVDMITASRAYQANLAALSTFRDMMLQTLRLGRP